MAAFRGDDAASTGACPAPAAPGLSTEGGRPLRRTILLALTLGLTVVPATTQAREPGCTSKSCDKRVRARYPCTKNACHERVAARQCSQTHVIPCIRAAALHYRQPFGDALRVAKCESSYNPYNEYLGHVGLFQFLWHGVKNPLTWGTTPYRSYSPWSARYNSLAAMWMWSVGRRNEWACT